MSLFRELRELEEDGVDLIDLLGQDRFLESPEALQQIIQRLRDVNDNLYVELLFHLTYRRFPESEADALWKGIMGHKAKLERALGRKVGFRVAAIEYLEGEKRILRGVRLIARPEFESILSFVHIDEVSGVYSRRYFNDRLAEEVGRARRYGNPLTLLLLDLDAFKLVNDRCGHVVGDATLRQIGRLLKETTRQTDAVCRFGGDEFALILPETDASAASVTGERIRKAVSSFSVPVSPEGINGIDIPDAPKLTLSIGGACYPANCEEAEELVALADQMCLEAKRAGKNRVHVAASEFDKGDFSSGIGADSALEI